MENPDPEEPLKKKPHHFNSLSPTSMARNTSPSHPSSKSGDAAMLQLENQKLVQQLDLRKQQLHDLETKIKELRVNQNSYDDLLITINQQWDELVDDLILLGMRAGAGRGATQVLDREYHRRGSIPPCAAEDIFLCRLLQVESIETSSIDRISKVEKALDARRSSTMELMKLIEDTIARQRASAESIARVLHDKKSAEDIIIQVPKIDGLMKEEAKNLQETVDALHMKHKEFDDSIQTYVTSHSSDQSEIKRLAGELDEIMGELEESRRKLINLRMQKDAASEAHAHTAGTTNGSLSPEKPIDKTRLRELKDSIEESKIVAADRLSELQEAQEYNLVLSKQLQDLESELKDDNYIHSSRLYNLVNDQLHHWNVELDRYRILVESFQADRSFVNRKERELNMRAESLESATNSSGNADGRIEELEQQLQRCIIENNDLEIKMEEAVQDSDRKDVKSEFLVMASAMSKDMEMMELQLNRWKETADEAVSLRKEAQSLKTLLETKVDEEKGLDDKCAAQLEEIDSLKSLIEKTKKEKLELQNLVDMYTQEGNDQRDLAEIKDSESRAHAQAESLKNALDEHFLELRVKAAKEAEAACQQRLSAAKVEIAELKSELDISEREVLELTEAIKIKEREAESYISEIETIGQAYEDMQTQNQHLLQQVTERDDYNIKLVSESVKTKHAHSSLLSEKQALAKQLKQVNASVESLKARIAHGEEQMKVCLSEAFKLVQEDRHLAVTLETTKWELADAEKELKWLKSAVASSEKEFEQIQRRTSDIKLELEEERNERKKLEEELMELNKELDELSSESVEAATLRLQEEIKSCKNILKCGVCFDRPKEVVIVKCYHLFCNQCIQRNLEIRHRKCPGCGTAFGQNDVRFVKM